MKLKAVLAILVCLVGTLSLSAANAPADFLSAGKVDDAVRSLEAQVQKNPADAQAYHLLSRAYYRLKKWDAAIADGERAVQLNPNKSDYYLWLGRAYGEKADNASFLSAPGLAKKCRANFEKAVQLDPKNLDALSDLTEFYVEAPGVLGGGLDKAQGTARQLAALDPVRGHWAYARIAEKQKDPAAAEREYMAAIKASPDADNWLNLASFYQRQHRLEDMENAVTKAMSSGMKKSNSLYDAASLLSGSGRNLAGAAAYLRRYLSLPQQNEEAPAFEAHYKLGTILEKQGDKAGAANEFRASLAMAGDYKPAQDALKHIG